MVRFAKNHKYGHKTKMHWLQSDQKLLLRGQWYHFQKNACFRKFEILPKILPDFKRSPRTLCVEGIVLLTKNH